MDKKNWLRQDVEIFVMSEMLAYECYDLFIKQNVEEEYVDVLLKSLFCYYDYPDVELDILCQTKAVLKRDYNVDICELPFENSEVKELVKNRC